MSYFWAAHNFASRENPFLGGCPWAPAIRRLNQAPDRSPTWFGRPCTDCPPTRRSTSFVDFDRPADRPKKQATLLDRLAATAYRLRRAASPFSSIPAPHLPAKSTSPDPPFLLVVFAFRASQRSRARMLIQQIGGILVLFWGGDRPPKGGLEGRSPGKPLLGGGSTSPDAAGGKARRLFLCPWSWCCDFPPRRLRRFWAESCPPGSSCFATIPPLCELLRVSCRGVFFFSAS